MVIALSTFNGTSREGYYLNFNKDEIFKALIASEGHFRNFTKLKEDKAGFLNCIVKHLADAEGHCDEAISHALIAESEDSSRGFLELRDMIRDLRSHIQSSPITRDEGIREVRRVRRHFEGFNPDYDVSKCETCGAPSEVVEEIAKILNDLKMTPLAAVHEPDHKGLYSIHEHSHSESKMVKTVRDVGVIYGGQNIGQGIERAAQWADTQMPLGIGGVKLSLITDILGALGGIAGALYLRAPWDMLAALIGGHLSTDLWRQAEMMMAGLPLAQAPLAIPPAGRYTVKPQLPLPPTPRTLAPVGRYRITG